MAVAKMKKIYLICHQSVREKLLDTLQRKGLLHIINLHDEISKHTWRYMVSRIEPNLDDLELLLSKINYILKFLNLFSPPPRGLISGLVPEKFKVAQKDFENIREEIPFEQIYEECENLDTARVKMESEFSQLETFKEDLLPWLELDVTPTSVTTTPYTEKILGQLPLANEKALQAEMQKLTSESVICEVNRDASFVYLFIAYHRRFASQAAELLAKYDFEKIKFDKLSHRPKEEIKRIENRLKQIEKTRLQIAHKAKQLTAKWRPKLLVLKDFIQNEYKKLKIQNNLANTEKTFLIEGWVKERDLPFLHKSVEQISKEAEILALDPAPDDKPPVILENPKIVKPFEVLTKIYGLPDYKELDPTPYLAPFFALFLGMCIGDFGYGLVLVLSGWLLYKKFGEKVSENVNNFFRVLSYGGLASMIIGILTGTYFAIPTQSLPIFLKKLVLLDPLADAQIFLAISLFLGIIHVCLGVLLEGIDKVRRGNLAGAIAEDLTTFIFLASAIFWVIVGSTSITSSHVSAKIKSLQFYANWFLLFSTLGVIIGHGRKGKSIFGKLGTGLYSLYGMSSFIGDFLSYARLMALGLATLLIGYVVNLLGQMVFSLPILGVILALLILLVGHSFNLAINLLGAIVHPLRLQYVEFFSKFYENGGADFEPLRIETEHLIIEKAKR